MEIITAIVFASIILESIATALDVIWTDRGLRTTAFIEGNKLLQKLFGNKPSFKQLAVFNLVETCAVVSAAVVGCALGNVAMAIGGTGIILANAARHYFKGYLAWKKILS